MILTIYLIVLGTSILSGVLGMGGGMILMGFLSFKLKIVDAMIFHGVTQAFSNGSRAFINKENIKWSILPIYFLGVISTFTILNLVSFLPSKHYVFICIGSFPFVALISQKFINLDILKRHNAFICGILVTVSQLTAGASGPLLDMFYLNTKLNRFEVIATKAFTQFIGHLLKIVFYFKLIFIAELNLGFPIYSLVIAAFIASLGSRLSKIFLKKVPEKNFKNYSKFVISIIGIIFLFNGLSILLR